MITVCAELAGVGVGPGAHARFPSAEIKRFSVTPTMHESVSVYMFSIQLLG